MSFANLSFPNAPMIKHVPPGPLSKQFLDFQSSNEGSSVSYPLGLPMSIKRAKGATIEDVDGNLYIDFFAGAGVMSLGHSNPQLIDRVKQQLDDFTHTLDIPNPARQELVANLIEILPDDINKVYFGGPTGSDAIEVALKLAKINTGRTSFIAFEGGYHGMTSGALSITSDKYHKKGLMPLLPNIHFVPYAYCYRCVFNQSPDSCNLECAKYFEHVLEDPHSGVEKPAAVILEAIQGEGGTIVPPDEYLIKIREICDRYDVLMIVDEVQAGFCRTGKMFAFEHSGILPDIIVLSKALGGIGMPISCVAYKQKLDKLTPGMHIGTFRGNAIAYAAGASGIEFMKKESLETYSEKLGQLFLSTVEEIKTDSDIIGEVRGKGLMIGVEIVTDKVSKTPASAYAKKIRQVCHQNGLLIEIGGHYSNVVRFLPPLVVTEELLLKGIGIFRDAVKAIEDNK